MDIINAKSARCGIEIKRLHESARFGAGSISPAIWNILSMQFILLRPEEELWRK